MTTTALNLIEGAARLIGVLNRGENLSADDAADGLISLNDLISSWSNDSLLIYARTWENFSLVAGTASYLIGASQTFNTVKPISVVSAFIREAGSDYPLTIISDEDYENIQTKTTQSNIPRFLNYDNGHPYGTIRLYETPGSANGLHLLTEKVLTNFALTSTTVDLPAGWNRALRYNLALDMAPEFGVKPTSEVVLGAKDSLGLIKTAISKNRPMVMDSKTGAGGNIFNGYYP